MVECKIHKDIDYFKQTTLIKEIQSKIFTEMKKINNYHVLHSFRDELPQELVEIEEDSNVTTKEMFLENFIYYLIHSLESDPSSWPFMEAVKPEEAPTYYTVISTPIDLSLILKKHKGSCYPNLQLFVDDVLLMVRNCLVFNQQETQYYKCGVNMKMCLINLLKKYDKTIKFWKCSVVYVE